MDWRDKTRAPVLSLFYRTVLKQHAADNSQQRKTHPEHRNNACGDT
jgi:hypothetical protein